MRWIEDAAAGGGPGWMGGSADRLPRTAVTAKKRSYPGARTKIVGTPQGHHNPKLGGWDGNFENKNRCQAPPAPCNAQVPRLSQNGQRTHGRAHLEICAPKQLRRVGITNYIDAS